MGVNSLAKTWDEARASCQLYQADLVNIDDAGEKVLISFIIKNKYYQKEKNFNLFQGHIRKISKK